MATTLHPARAALQEILRARRVGDWDLTEPLGRGGQGTTWRAILKVKDQSLTRVGFDGGRVQRAVVKLMLPPTPDQVPVPAARFDEWLHSEAKAFLVEAKILSTLDSPYIPGVFEAAVQPTAAGWDLPWFATELISGRSLAEHVSINGPMDQNQLLDLAHDILSALAAIHHVGLVHLDLKPDNVMLEPGRARLIDFGLVTKARQVGRFAGTPGFFTPEQLDDVLDEGDFDPAADVFKLGVTLAIASGMHLPDLWGIDPRGESEAVRRAMKNGPRLSALQPAVQNFIRPMLAFDPRARPTAASGLELVREMLPPGNSKATGRVKDDLTRRNVPPSPAERSARAAAAGRSPQASTGDGRQANVGAKVVVLDRMGLDWTGIVVDLDSKRPGNVLVRHESTRGSQNVRSYPISQVLRGNPVR